MIAERDLRCETDDAGLRELAGEAPHLGLILDKFATQLKRDENGGDLQLDKNHALKRLGLDGVSPRPCPTAGADVDARTQRFATMLTTRGGRCGIGRLETRLAIGLGQESPLENGVLLHPTLSVPYLPGSSLKGLARAFAEHWAPYETEEEKAALEAAIVRIFGPRRRGDETGNTGSVIFFDALPISPVCRLEKDVMTPHQAEYYGADPEAAAPPAPADWNSPTPLEFVTLASGIDFRVMLAPRTSHAAGDDVSTAWNWLVQALDSLGIGGKTASGYGRIALTSEVSDAVDRSRPHP